MEFPDDPVITNMSGYALPRTSWALVKDGVIEGISLTYDPIKPPFPDVPVASPGAVPLTGTVAVVVTGTRAIAGHLIDHRGNTTPAEGRKQALKAGFPAYHDGIGEDPGQIAPESAELEIDDHGETDGSEA